MLIICKVCLRYMESLYCLQTLYCSSPFNIPYQDMPLQADLHHNPLLNYTCSFEGWAHSQYSWQKHGNLHCLDQRILIQSLQTDGEIQIYINSCQVFHTSRVESKLPAHNITINIVGVNGCWTDGGPHFMNADLHTPFKVSLAIHQSGITFGTWLCKQKMYSEVLTMEFMY